MSESFNTVRDPFFSVYQSAVNAVAAKIDMCSGQNRTGAARRGAKRSASSVLTEIAAEIVDREFRKQNGERILDPSECSARELSKLGIARVCAEMGLRYLKALAANDEVAMSLLKSEFTAGTCDPAWISTIEEYRKYFGKDGRRKPIPYIRAKEVGHTVINIKNDARIALVSDWGTGASPALDVLSAIASHKPDLLIHLGDVYYSGTPEECKANFSDPIERILRKGSTIPVYTLSGNHDMYSGGIGFYDLIANLNPDPYKQPASFFCLRSIDESWQFLAMDTGLHDDNPMHVANSLTSIEEDEISWHCDRIKEFAGRTILLSHHPLFSAFAAIGASDKDGRRSPTNPLLANALQRLQSERKVAAWFWGHEHVLSIYEEFGDLERGRCIGHGAIPVSIIDKIYEVLPGLDVVPNTLPGTTLSSSGGFFNHGYAIASLRSGACDVDYYQVVSTEKKVVFRETI